MKFPEGFAWGSATSSYQVEGGIENNDWASFAKASEGQGQPKIPFAGRACDHYNRYEEDFDVAKSLGQNAHRFSIEWARIEPEEGKFNEAEIEHYREVIKALRERGIEPFVTLWHFTLPIWFAYMGGFENPKSPEIFTRYCKFVVSKLGDRAKFWMTINEPMVYASGGYRKGKWPPFKKNLFKFLKVINNLVMSHNVVYREIKKVLPSAQIGIAKNNIYFHSNHNPFYSILSSLLNWFWNYRFLDKIEKQLDFVGMNYYFHHKFGGEKIVCEKSDMGWDICPEGIFYVAAGLKKYGKPIYVTENGLADAKDTKRAEFVRKHLYWISEAMQTGADIRGYFYWSLLDNFEWADGFEPKFGLVEVDLKTMERKIRPSAYEYAKICRENRL